MSKDLYILGNLKVDDTNSSPWMCSISLVELVHSDYITLQLLQDIHLNFILSKNDLIKMTLYKINVSSKGEFTRKRGEIFKNNDYSDNFISSLGFKKVKDFRYIINKKERSQYFDDITLTFSYTEHERIPPGKYYIDCPHIVLPI